MGLSYERCNFKIGVSIFYSIKYSKTKPFKSICKKKYYEEKKLKRTKMEKIKVALLYFIPRYII